MKFTTLTLLLVFLSVVSLRAGADWCGDLTVTGVQGTRASLSVTAPTNASLNELDVRMSTIPITTFNFASRTRLVMITSPGTPGQVREILVTELQPGTKYYFAVKFKDATGWASLPSNLAIGTTSPSSTNTQVVLGWEPSPDPNAVGYNIYYGTSSGNYAIKKVVGNVTTVTLDLPPTDGTVTYFFAATTYDAANQESGFSNEATYTPP